MVMGSPFLTTAHGHFHLPVVGDLELSSAMAFDAGVLLSVVGAVRLTLSNLARLGRRSEKAARDAAFVTSDNPHSESATLPTLGSQNASATQPPQEPTASSGRTSKGETSPGNKMRSRAADISGMPGTLGMFPSQEV